jgi:hypothetical protein
MILAAEDFGDLINFTVLLPLPGVLVLAWLVGRLLGVRRSWTATFNDLLQLFFTFGRGNFRARVSLLSDPHDEHVVTKLVSRTCSRSPVASSASSGRSSWASAGDRRSPATRRCTSSSVTSACSVASCSSCG